MKTLLVSSVREVREGAAAIGRDACWFWRATREE